MLIEISLELFPLHFRATASNWLTYNWQYANHQDNIIVKFPIINAFI